MDTAQPATVPVQVGLLGPLRLQVGEDLIDVPGPGRRAMLALLAMAGGRAVSVDAMLDALWPHDPPETGAAALHNHVSRLRRTLGPAANRLQRVGNGYALHLGTDELDVAVVRRAAAVVGALLQHNPALAAREAAGALARWRGVALEEFAEIAPLAADAVGLAELHTSLRDDAFEARLALGDRSVAAEVASAAAAEPLRERSATLLMRALAAEGRTADAMEVAAAFRRRLAEETGLDPGPTLAALEQEIASGALARSATDSGGGRRRNVARPRGPMVGREQDRDELHRLLETHSTVTVTGTGGVGKTRLVLDVLADLVELDQTTVFVPLAAVTDVDRVPEAVASALALRLAADPSVTSVTDALVGQDLLLVLDNCEHVVAACRELVTELQLRALGVRVLATSRATLHVPDEYVVRLQPLPLPSPASTLSELSRQPAVRAFVEHAARRQGGFALTTDNAASLVAVIRKLDGLPLAIELAAGQLAVLPVGALHDRLHRALDLLATERPEEQARHRTLRTTVAWSYRLLSPAEQGLLCALAPFPGGVDLETVELLTAETAQHTDPLVLLSRLVDASLVAVDQQSTARYTLLDTVRAFLLDELDAHVSPDGQGGRRAAEERFLRWAARTAEEIGHGLTGPDEPAADRRLHAELANLRAAHDLAKSYGELDRRVAIALPLVTGSTMRDISELWTWSRDLAADPALRGHPLEVVVLGSAAESSWLLGRMEEAEGLAERGLELARETGVPERLTLRCWNALATVSLFRADFDTSRRQWLRAAELSEVASVQLATAAMAASYGGDLESAEALLARALQLPHESTSVTGRAYVAYAAGEVAIDPAGAVAEYTRAIELSRTCGAAFVEGVATVGLASVWTSLGDAAKAADGFLMLLDYWPSAGNQTQLWTTVRNAALLLLDHGRTPAAALMLSAADAADSASAVGGYSGDRLATAHDTVARLLGPSELAAVSRRAASTSTHDLLTILTDELRGLRDRAMGSVPADDSALTAR